MDYCEIKFAEGRVAYVRHCKRNDFETVGERRGEGWELRSGFERETRALFRDEDKALEVQGYS